MKIRIPIICFILLLTGHLFAEEKKTIQVRFSITEPQYKDYYHSETKLIENKCAALMVDYLNKTFGFFHFTIGTNQPALHIELNDNERNIETNSALKEVGFKVFIKHQENLGSENPVYWVFRPVERYIESLPDVKEEFIDEIVQTFKIGVSKNKEELVKNILSKVEVADDFYFISSGKFLEPGENFLVNFFGRALHKFNRRNFFPVLDSSKKTVFFGANPGVGDGERIFPVARCFGGHIFWD